jgi:hypothetical protein
VSRQPKKEEKKANTQQKLKKKKPYANMTHRYEMMINGNKEYLKRKSCRFPQIGYCQRCTSYDVWKR